MPDTSTVAPPVTTLASGAAVAATQPPAPTVEVASTVGAFRDLVGDKAQYGPIPVPGIGQTLVFHPDWQAEVRRYNFYDTSYTGGPQYKSGLDAQGNAIMWRHNDLRESNEGFDRRKRMAVYVNYCRPIVNKFVDFVFRQQIQRDGQDPAFTAWCADVDTRSTHLNPFMRKVVKRACVLGRYLVGVDSNRPAEAGVLTRVQAQAAGMQMLLQRIDPRRMINWRRENGVLTEALILYGSGDMAILWRQMDKVAFALDDQGKVTSVEPGPHGWPSLPIIEVAPFEDGESQIRDIAELNRDAFNIGSLLREELYNATFTQRWAIGMNAADLEKALSGPSRIICVPNPEGKIQTTGGDPAQAQTLQTTVDSSVREIYRQAGMKAEDPLQVGQAKSGIALRVEFNDLAALLGAIAEEAERIEGEIVRFYNAAANAVVNPSDYPEEFGDPDVVKELGRSLGVLESDRMTPTAKFLESKRINGILHPRAPEDAKGTMAIESLTMFGPDGNPAKPLASPTDEARKAMAELLAAERGAAPPVEGAPPAGSAAAAPDAESADTGE